MIKKVIDGKKGKTLEPTFLQDKVIFYSFRENLPLGTEWKFELVGELIPLNKTDSKHTPMFLQKVKAVEMVIFADIMKAEYNFKKNKWIVPIYSGNVLIRHDEFDGEIKYVVCDFGSNLGCEVWNVLELNGNYRSQKINFYKYDDPKPDWLPENIYEETNKRCKIYVDKIKNMIEEKNTLIQERNKLLISINKPFGGLRDFILHGVKVHHFCDGETDHRLPYYGHEYCLYEINGFIYEIGVNAIDEECVEYINPMTSNGREENEEVIELLRDIALFAVHPKPYKVISRILKIDIPRKKFLFQKNVSITSEKEEELKMMYLQHSVNEVKNNYTPQIKEFNIENLIKIKFTSYIEDNVESYTDIEEGVGAKDNTVWYSRWVKAEVVEKWKVEYFIDDSVCQSIKESLLEILK